ncbi:MAG: hypothetical protein JO000_22625, partial [Alphaproteobacteria bacterium]|nr:hypothetical protein [Alphaproteobacteria bacterium]
MREGQRRAETLAFILSDHLVRTVSGIDTTLNQVAVAAGRLGGSNTQNDAWDPLLKAAKSGVSEIAILAVADAAGVIRHATLPSLVGQTRGEGFLFRRLASDPQAGLVADRPMRGMTSGQWIIPFGRRLLDAKGQFTGAVVATLEPERLRQFYRTIDVGRSGFISVLHPEQQVLFREPSA